MFTSKQGSCGVGLLSKDTAYFGGSGLGRGKDGGLAEGASDVTIVGNAAQVELDEVAAGVVVEVVGTVG